MYWARWYSDKKEFRVSTKQTSRKAAQDVLNELVTPYRMKDEAETLRTLASRAKSLEDESSEALRTDAALAHAWGWFAGTTSRKKKPRPATMDQYAVQWGIFKKWVSEHHPDVVTVEAVTLDVATAFIQDVQLTRTANTSNKYRNLLSMMWDVLRTDGRTVAENVWQKIPLLEVDQVSRRELTIEELQSVCRSAPDDLRPLFALGLYCGMRLGDCCTLKWAEVDLGRNVIRRVLNKSTQRRKVVLIPIHPVLKVIIDEQKRDGEYVLPRIASDYQRHPSYVTDRIQKHFSGCGIKTTVARDKGRSAVEVGFHSLRHSFVSLSRGAGAPLSVVEAIVGHSNSAMTRHYSHVGDDAALKAVSLLPDVTTKPETKPAKGAVILSLSPRVIKALGRAAKSAGTEVNVHAAELLARAVKGLKK